MAREMLAGGQRTRFVFVAAWAVRTIIINACYIQFYFYCYALVKVVFSLYRREKKIHVAGNLRSCVCPSIRVLRQQPSSIISYDYNIVTAQISATEYCIRPRRPSPPPRSYREVGQTDLYNRSLQEEHGKSPPSLSRGTKGKETTIGKRRCQPRTRKPGYGETTMNRIYTFVLFFYRHPVRIAAHVRMCRSFWRISFGRKIGRKNILFFLPYFQSDTIRNSSKSH